MNTNRLNDSSNRRRRDPEQTPLRAARLAKGLSQAELAAAAGLSPGWISLLERTPARRQLHLPTGDNYTSPSLRLAGR